MKKDASSVTDGLTSSQAVSSKLSRWSVAIPLETQDNLQLSFPKKNIVSPFLCEDLFEFIDGCAQ
jgi:hypothetical protein